MTRVPSVVDTYKTLQPHINNPEQWKLVTAPLGRPIQKDLETVKDATIQGYACDSLFESFGGIYDAYLCSFLPVGMRRKWPKSCFFVGNGAHTVSETNRVVASLHASAIVDRLDGFQSGGRSYGLGFRCCGGGPTSAECGSMRSFTDCQVFLSLLRVFQADFYVTDISRWPGSGV